VEGATGHWIAIPQQVMLAPEDAMQDVIDAVAKIKDNATELQ
jgi:hypothetical protein